MAEHKISGDDVLLFIGTDGVTYDTVVCLTSNGITRATNTIDAKTKCGPDSQPGTQTNGVSFEGQVLADPSSGKISTDELDDHWRNKTTIYYKHVDGGVEVGCAVDYAAYLEFGTGKFAAEYVATLPTEWKEFASQFKGSAGGNFREFVESIMGWLS